jgi:hypothetical protein
LEPGHDPIKPWVFVQMRIFEDDSGNAQLESQKIIIENSF